MYTLSVRRPQPHNTNLQTERIEREKRVEYYSRDRAAQANKEALTLFLKPATTLFTDNRAIVVFSPYVTTQSVNLCTDLLRKILQSGAITNSTFTITFSAVRRAFVFQFYCKNCNRREEILYTQKDRVFAYILPHDRVDERGLANVGIPDGAHSEGPQLTGATDRSFVVTIHCNTQRKLYLTRYRIDRSTKTKA